MKEHDSVVLTRDLPEHGLEAGDMGAIVHAYPVAYEVEFAKRPGATSAVVTLEPGDVRPITESDILQIRSRVQALESLHDRIVSVGFIVAAYLVAAMVPILGILLAIYLTFHRERLHSYGVWAVTLISLTLWGAFLNW